MAGVKGRSGGRRAGAGRKAQPLEERQFGMRQVVVDAVTDDDWRQVTATALTQAKDGDATARAWLSSWVMGAAPKELTLKGDDDHPMVFVIE